MREGRTKAVTMDTKVKSYERRKLAKTGAVTMDSKVERYERRKDKSSSNGQQGEGL